MSSNGPATIMANVANGAPPSSSSPVHARSMEPKGTPPKNSPLVEIWKNFFHPFQFLLHPLHGLVRYVYRVGWQKAVSSLIISMLTVNAILLMCVGYVIEWVGNTVFKGQYPRPDELPLPKGEGKPQTIKLTIIGLQDRNFELDQQTVDTFPSESPSARTNAEVCCMASKIIYENGDLVKHIVDNVWNKKVKDGENFQFLEWYDYKTGGQDRVDTQAMLLKKGHAIIVAFRGTEPFSAVDWATDFRFTWWDGIPALGRVHTGFLNSLGLGFPEEKKLTDFADYIKKCLTRYRQEAKRRDETAGRKSRAPFRDLRSAANAAADPNSELTALTNFLKEYVLKDPSTLNEDPGAPLSFNVCKRGNIRKDAPLYWKIRLALENALRDDKEAKIYITGHSLGGALAALFTGLLMAEDDVMADRIGGLYTFGQPRVGDWSFAWYLHNKLNVPEPRYVRLVYSNDLVPRVPFDDDRFQYKHLGPFYWSNAFYDVTVGTFNDQPALGLITPYLTSIVEFHYNVTWNYIANKLFRTNQRPLENGVQVFIRALSILAPRIAAHSPTNYLNAVRYGFPHGKQKKQPPT